MLRLALLILYLTASFSMFYAPLDSQATGTTGYTGGGLDPDGSETGGGLDPNGRS
jgi:hypothetical protein